jgi:hypothetical protein
MRALLTEMVPQMETLMKTMLRQDDRKPRVCDGSVFVDAMPGAAAPDQRKDAKEPDHE